MDLVTPYVPRARRSARRQAIFACALGAYLALFAAGALTVAALALPTATAAVVVAIVGTLLLGLAGAVWAVDTVAARRQTMATVTPLRARGASAPLSLATPRRIAN